MSTHNLFPSLEARRHHPHSFPSLIRTVNQRSSPFCDTADVLVSFPHIPTLEFWNTNAPPTHSRRESLPSVSLSRKSPSRGQLHRCLALGSEIYRRLGHSHRRRVGRPSRSGSRPAAIRTMGPRHLEYLACFQSLESIWHLQTWQARGHMEYADGERGQMADGGDFCCGRGRPGTVGQDCEECG